MFQPYDFLMIAVLAGLTLHGYSKGMAWQIAYLGSLIASYFVALKFADQFAPMFGDSAPFNKFVAMLVIYIVTSFFIWMGFRVVRGAIDKVKMEGFDHQMGALIGAARGFLWCVGITFFAVTLLPQGQKEWILQTKSGRTIAVALNKTQTFVPPEVHQVIGPVIQRIEQGLQQGGQPGQPMPGQPQPSTPSNQPLWPTQQPYGQQPAGQGWPATGQSASQPTSQQAGQLTSQPTGWPNPNPGGSPAGAWPQANPGYAAQPPQPTYQPQPSGVPAQPAAWPNPSP
ncbi:Colicin V production protein [Posidoniimonas polymericola]|uniref:Colicin V production protein n=1 Tax=Posidoniimonas polymericola TaxID=2528002 RepID=A0A5C5YSW5_9BACT|nr:CvpA family protein [Posidoniimonas polymericola]TWT78018.1 Colicin V production protein [Posidoniimonas polymericola]